MGHMIRWTKEEIAKYEEGIKLYGTDHIKIAEHIDNEPIRTAGSVLYRLHIKSGLISKEEFDKERARYKKVKAKERYKPAGSTISWNVIQPLIKQRDGNVCLGKKCRNGNPTTELEVNHLVPYERCKEHRADNLVTLCADCHNRIGKRICVTRSLMAIIYPKWYKEIESVNPFNKQDKIFVAEEIQSPI